MSRKQQSAIKYINQLLLRQNNNMSNIFDAIYTNPQKQTQLKYSQVTSPTKSIKISKPKKVLNKQQKYNSKSAQSSTKINSSTNYFLNANKIAIKQLTKIKEHPKLSQQLQLSLFNFTKPTQLFQPKYLQKQQKQKIQKLGKKILQQLDGQSLVDKRKKNIQCQYLVNIPPLVVKTFVLQNKIDQKITANQIYSIFNKFLRKLRIIIKQPIVKRYKNKVYFGSKIQQMFPYQGFKIQFGKSIFYGNFINERKNGYGIEINFQNHITYQGQFLDDNITGNFKVTKQFQNYKGSMLNGAYHGKGELKTLLSKYKGYFMNGLRHGQGQQFFFLSGLAIKGYFDLGVLKIKADIKQKILNLNEYKSTKINLFEKHAQYEGNYQSKNYEEFSFSLDELSIESLNGNQTKKNQ